MAPWMLGNSLASPLLSLSSAFCLSSTHSRVTAPILNPTKLLNGSSPYLTRLSWTSNLTSTKWVTNCSSKTGDLVVLSDKDKKTWETSRAALSAFNFSVEEEDKLLGKAFGLIHSPYWGEERKKEVPKFEVIEGILEYLKSLGLSDDDLLKLLKKFPEVLGCSLESGLKANVQILEKDWGIKGKTLRNLLLRNPKVLGYNVDCKGDCMAQCTRCWVRF